MNLGKINVITPPDKLFNLNIGILLVKPSAEFKSHFQKYISRVIDETNVFVYDETENDMDWLLSVHQKVNITVIDVDNCDPITKSFVTLLLAYPETYYLTSDETTPYGLISKNRIYDLDAIPFFSLEEWGDPDDEQGEEDDNER
jgi:hypothetical protein